MHVSHKGSLVTAAVFAAALAMGTTAQASDLPTPPSPKKLLKKLPKPPSPKKVIKEAPKPPSPDKVIKHAPKPPSPDKVIKNAPKPKLKKSNPWWDPLGLFDH